MKLSSGMVLAGKYMIMESQEISEIRRQCENLRSEKRYEVIDRLLLEAGRIVDTTEGDVVLAWLEATCPFQERLRGYKSFYETALRSLQKREWYNLKTLEPLRPLEPTH